MAQISSFHDHKLPYYVFAYYRNEIHDFYVFLFALSLMPIRHFIIPF